MTEKYGNWCEVPEHIKPLIKKALRFIALSVINLILIIAALILAITQVHYIYILCILGIYLIIRYIVIPRCRLNTKDLYIVKSYRNSVE